MPVLHLFGVEDTSGLSLIGRRGYQIVKGKYFKPKFDRKEKILNIILKGSRE